MARFLSALRILSAIAVIVIAVLLCGQCLDIYLKGSSSQNLDTGGVRLVSMFRMEDVAARLKGITLPLIVCCLLIAVCTILHWLFQMHANDATGSTPRRSCMCKEHAGNAAAQSASIRVAQAILLLISVVLIVLGVINGGMRDVLVKAINICTECIGLG